MSTINVTNLSGRGGATPNLPDGANITGVATATTFSGTLDGSLKTTGTPTLGLGVTINASGIAISGVATAGILSATTLYGDGSNLTGVGESIAPWYYNPGVSEEANIDTGIGIRFNKKIVAGSGTATLKIVSAGVAGTTIQSWGISSVTIADATSFTATILNSLQNNAVYQFSVPEGFVVSSTGTNYVGTAYTFDTSEISRQLWSWGYNTQGQLGVNDRAGRSSPIQIPGSKWGEVASVGTSGGTGGNNWAVKTDGTMWIVGDNDKGQLGQNQPTSTDRSSPVQIPGTTWSADSEKFAMGTEAAGAIKTDGTLWSWGYNNQGGLGQNQSAACKDYSSPVQIPGTTWSKISVGRQGMAAIKTDGTLWSWGYGRYGMQGTNTGPSGLRSSPVQIPGTTWRTIFRCDTPGAQQIATKTDGTLWTWGGDASGSLGINEENAKRSSPVQIPGTTWASAKTTGHTSIATKTDGTLWMWGKNAHGQLGNEDTTHRSSPVQVPGTTWGTSMSDIAQEAYGSNASCCVRKTDGTLWSWGYNDQGNLGHNDRTARNSPVQVGTDTSWSMITGIRNGYAAIKSDTTP